MEQIERARRYLQRIREMYLSVPYKEDPEYYADDVLSFFIHAYHIKDWILRLNKVGVTEHTLEAFINRHEELRICADLCNGSKHCKLKHKRTSRQPHLASKRFVSGGTNDEMENTQCKFEILAESKFIDALELAERCMKLWDEFVEEMRKSANKAIQPTRLRASADG